MRSCESRSQRPGVRFKEGQNVIVYHHTDTARLPEPESCNPAVIKLPVFPTPILG